MLDGWATTCAENTISLVCSRELLTKEILAILGCTGTGDSIFSFLGEAAPAADVFTNPWTQSSPAWDLAATSSRLFAHMPPITILVDLQVTPLLEGSRAQRLEVDSGSVRSGGEIIRSPNCT